MGMSARSDSPASDAAACLDAAMRVAVVAGHSGARAVVQAGPAARTLTGVAREIGADTIVLGSVSLEIAGRTDRTLVLVA